jgi:DNA-binding GntR family transcriptional regulator
MSAHNHQSRVEYHVLKIFSESEGATGTWNINRMMRAKQFNISQATIGRILFKLEEEGYLEKAGGQRGRRITSTGIQSLTQMEMGIKREDYLQNLIQSIQKNTLETALHHTQVRKMLEPAAARDAARYATKEEIEEMRRSIHTHRQALAASEDVSGPATSFHLCIAEASQNKILSSFVHVLIDERKINDIVDAIGWKRNTRSEQDHREILKAIEQGDAELAEKLMLMHLERIESIIMQEIEKEEKVK